MSKKVRKHDHLSVKQKISTYTIGPYMSTGQGTRDRRRPSVGVPGVGVRAVEAVAPAAEALDDHVLVREHHHEGAFLGVGECTGRELDDLDQGQRLAEGVVLIGDLTG